jgi:PST family polysaccharide transporter
MEAEDGMVEFGTETAAGGFAFTAASVFRSVAVLATFIVLARLLAPSAFGLFTIVTSLYFIFEAFSYFGIGTTIMKMLPQAKTGKEVARIINGAVLTSLLIGAAFMLVMLLTSSLVAVRVYGNPSLTTPIRIAAVMLIADLLFYVCISSLLGLRKNREAGMSNFAFGLGWMVFTIPPVLAGYGVSGAVLGLFMGYLFAFAVSLVYLARSVRLMPVRPQRKLLSRIVTFSAPIFVNGLSSTVATNFGVLLLGVFASAAVVGNYGVAYKLGSFASVIVASGTSVLLPAFSHAFSRKRLSRRIGTIYNSGLYYTLLVLLPLLVYMVSVAVPFMEALFGYAYALAPPYFVVIAAGITLGVIGQYASMLIVGHGNVRTFMMYQLYTVALEITLLLVLTPYLQAVGLLVALFVIGPLFLNAIYARLLLRKFSFRLDSAKLLRLLSASVASGAVLEAVAVALRNSRVLLLLNAGLLLILYPSLLALSGGIDAKDMAFIRKATERMRLVKPAAACMIGYTMLFMKSRPHR